MSEIVTLEPAKRGKTLRHDPAHQRAAALARAAASHGAALSQAIALQKALFDVGLLIATDAKASVNSDDRARSGSVLSGVAKGWQSIQDQIRILRGKPLPGSLRPQVGKVGRPKREGVSPVKESL